ncbi:hypothetical protein FAI40_04640 [Acetobacteraceae bacterium]|nr:hypothetical protein FAI40_04640 [Acetobacteraceae bacterium]
MRKNLSFSISLAGFLLTGFYLPFFSTAHAEYLDEARGEDHSHDLHHKPRSAQAGKEESHSDNLFDMFFKSKAVKSLFFGEDPDEKEEKIDEHAEIEHALSGDEEDTKNPVLTPEEEEEQRKIAEEEAILNAPPETYKPKPKIEIIGELKGEWVFHYQPVGGWGDPPNPMIKLVGSGEEKNTAIEIMLVQQMVDFQSKSGYAARDFYSVKVSDKYFACDRTPIRLWFDEGKLFDSQNYIETGPTICHEEFEGGEEQEEEPEKEIIGQSSPKDFFQSKKLVKLVNNYHPIAISQGTKALLLNYGDGSPLYRFARSNNPLTNQGYFDSKKAYFKKKEQERAYEAARRHARGNE